jgi:hypothetical protein
MKIAVVLSGYFGTISTNDMQSGINSHKKITNFFKDYDVDYYIHSWQTEDKDKIIDLYSPKKTKLKLKYKFEPQINFNITEKKICDNQKWFDDGFDRNNTIVDTIAYKNATIYNSLSFFYSRSSALKLIEGDYDRVFVMRLDIGNKGGDSVNFPHKFDFNSDANKIYTPYWNQLNIGLGDMWTIMNVEDANKLSNIYDKVKSYYQTDSEYVNKMLNGWPMSEKCEFNTTSKEQFSNICLTDRTAELMTYPKWYCVNNHSLYKYFFIDMDMYKKLKFI